MHFVKKVFVVFAFLIIFFKAKSFYSNIQVSKKYFLVLDNQLSESLATSISEFINQNLAGLTPKEFNQRLQEKFPIIKSVVIRRTNPDFLTVIIQIHEPVYQINDDKIFSHNGKIFSKEDYHDNFSGLEAIRVRENLEKSELLNELKKFDSKDLVQDFVIEWLNKNKIILTNKIEPNFFIIIKHNKIPDQKTIQLCHKLYQEHLQAKPKIKKNRNIVFDLRFAEQIILSEN
ncbi:MAG: FtsQ-type POTRA domain-containing protein [Candidatus Babeliales bacterium]|nr:FtsQ-type POTRA domain-containing protein [Candidatus Babeliales bacterium]